MKLKNKIFIILRFSISFILVYWLIQNGELGFKNVEVGLSNIKLALLFLAITFCQLLIGSIRTHFLMKFPSSSHINYKNILSITWASSFISCIAPSAVFAEAFRIKELIIIDPNLNKDNTIYALFFSKLFSIFSLVIITTGSSFALKNHP
ncbi:lysylphosphatidylglycerol synthase domain-containing protein, partial [Thermodesulfobacteriota bacterium]